MKTKFSAQRHRRHRVTQREVMKRVKLLLGVVLLLVVLNACARKQYVIKSVDGYLVEMNNTYDDGDEAKMSALIRPYKVKLDAEMNTVIGEAAKSLTKTGTQSVLANFTADAMLAFATELWGPVDFAVINNGGLRTTINQGPVTIGNVYEVYAFDNTLVLLDLPGAAVKELFTHFAQKKMDGFSKSVSLVLKDKAVESITIGGRLLDEKAVYKVVTVDYLAEGNDGMDALTQATGYVDSHIMIRDAMIASMRKLTSANKLIDATPDERLDIKD